MKTQPEDTFIDILTQSYTHIDGVKNIDSRCELDLGCGSGSFTAGLAKRYCSAAKLTGRPAAATKLGAQGFILSDPALILQKLPVIPEESRHHTCAIWRRNRLIRWHC